VAEPPVPGSVPKLSLGTAPGAEKPPSAPKVGLKKGLKPGAPPPIKVAVKPPGAPKPGTLLKKRSALSPIAKAGVAVLVIAAAVGGIYFYRIFFPPPAPEVRIKVDPIVKKVPAKDPAADAKAAELKAAADAKDDAPTPTPTPTVPPAAVEDVMASTNLTSDVKVNSTHLDAAHAASPEFRAYVANASIGGVFQGKPARALINGVIVREGQVVDSPLAIAFERIDAANKIIYFRDATGAEVSKNY
jgi:hypothetical protein